jgi:endogenous inhibitor of DNA gyrase (YacG/DUF329 family)
MATRVKCPMCSVAVEWSPANPYRPFCSQRCKLADLGAWASGQYSVPSDIDEESLSPERNRDED